MPLDINAFRVSSGGDPEIIRESQRRRFAPVELVDEIIANDEKWRLMTGQIDNLRKDRNTVQKAVATKMKAKEPCEEGKAEVKKIGDEILAVEEEQKSLKIVIDKQVRMSTMSVLTF
jgi:seryl-tRNA synthetase